ncbi:hypothetical protein U1Q18_052170 [Sarracenia purpurea var. burkii]
MAVATKKSLPCMCSDFSSPLRRANTDICSIQEGKPVEQKGHRQELQIHLPQQLSLCSFRCEASSRLLVDTDAARGSQLMVSRAIAESLPLTSFRSSCAGPPLC